MTYYTTPIVWTRLSTALFAIALQSGCDTGHASATLEMEAPRSEPANRWIAHPGKPSDSKLPRTPLLE